MLRGLAEYSMSGRRQAVTVALLFGLMPMLNVLSGAVVALVTLRKGWQEGFLVLLWALLPAGLQWLLGDASAVFMLIAALVTAQALRSSSSWPGVLVLMTILGLLVQLSLAWQPAYVAQVTTIIEQMLAQDTTLQEAAALETGTASAADVVDLLLRFYGALHILVFVGCLAIARHWQALLYNPEGFRLEFHALRMDPRVMGVLLALLLAGELGLPPLNGWVPVFCMAPLINGLALIHHVVARRKLGVNWLVLTYLFTLLMAPAVIVLGFADSFANIRKRLNPGR